MDYIIIGSRRFGVQFAITEEEQQRGLMYQHPPTPVMVFPFKKAKVTKFWMKNTYAPLDILFCNDNKIVACHKGVPLSEKLIGPDSPTNLVIEFPENSVEKYAINVGDKVKIHKSIKTLAKWYDDLLMKSST